MLKDIVERPSQPPSASTSSPQPPTPGSTGFPVAQHRSQRPASAFARSRKQQQARQDGQRALGEGRAVDVVPSIQISAPRARSEVDEVRDAVDKENTARVEGMSSEEREQEIEELKERFGESVLETMTKRREARARSEAQPTANGSSSSSTPQVPVSLEQHMGDAQKVLEEVSEENERKVRSMGTQEVEQEVEELQERFGSKVMEALRKRAESRSGKGKAKEVAQPEDQQISSPGPSSTSPRVRFVDQPSQSQAKPKNIPSTASESSKLQWTQPLASTSSDASIRFDLSGNVLSDSAKSDLPTHLGLHHHGSSPDLAGYTLQDILYLCRSTVPSQRITMMSVLAKIVSRLRATEGELRYSDEVETECADLGVVQQAIELGVEVLAGLTRGVGVIHAGVDLLFQALGGPSWSWINHDAAICRAFAPDTNATTADTPTGLASVPFEDVLPRLTELLSIEDGLSEDTTQQLILILRRATFSSQQVCESITPIVPYIVRQHVVQRSWPPKNDRSPSVDALRLLRDISASSRASAEDLLSQGVYETTLKFVITATWTGEDVDNDTLRHGQALALEILRTYQVLGRYGLSSSVVTSSGEVWRRLGVWVQNRCTGNAVSAWDTTLVEAYFQCLSIWTTCAVDPHRTTPEHDITWAQVSALNWTDEAIYAITTLIERKDRWSEIASALDLLVSWTKGAQVNGVKGGEDEKSAVLNGLKSVDWNVLVDHGREHVLRVLAPLVQLHVQLHPIGELLDANVLSQIRQLRNGKSDTAATHTTSLDYHLLLIDVQSEAEPPARWLPKAIDVLNAFQIGDEPLALDLVDLILKADWKKSASSELISSLLHPDGLQVIRPLLQYAVLPDVESVVAPTQPSHLYLKATKTLRPPVPPSSDEKPAIVGLPIQPDWVFSPLNELLRSGTSVALSQVPPDWNASETEVVQATLLLAELAYVRPEGLDRSRVLFNLMKVFMLEHGQQSSTSTSDGEVFRDPIVTKWMSSLMAKLVNTDSTTVNSNATNIAAPLEVVSLPFLGSGVPFFQFYTDFLALYEAISFSDTLFAQCVIAPLSMSYPPDYRKLLWNDHSTALRGMKLSLDQVPLESTSASIQGKDNEGGLRAYLYPIETNPEVLNGYARALIRRWIAPSTHLFLATLALHHLAGLFWLGMEEGKESTRVGLMIMLLANGDDDLLKMVTEWDLDSLGKDTVGQEEKERRKQVVGDLTGERGRKRVESI
ncbi:hypothetical protein CI109_105698 [Kwoniella shandongensis]|uniref:Uncharacterized protein n=1 Tax=Kwoniella shandongensis TaxID=1734106 RepID=A0A5M6C055_9TREE|nr:uncharacterized protein CI109_003039 [Kwoniella shandongensis]KAA5528507.1 hypothetical protein CI109_003039 [Kwoniella shandongensis]